MRILTKLLILLTLPLAAQAQVWPVVALSSADAGSPFAPAGHISLRVAGAMLKSDHWRDTRSRFGVDLGLGRGLGLSLASSTRSLKGYGAFKKGIEDTRFGLSYWPEISPRIAVGMNGYFSIPTGYRRQETYYDPSSATTRTLPDMSLRQTAGEWYAGAIWKINPVADLNLFGGYFSSSDRTEQSFRWGMGTRLAPIGESVWAELNYNQSIVRSGALPTTETFEAALPFKAGTGITIVPGMWADLDAEPLYGASLGLRFSFAVPGMVTHPVPHAIVAPPRIAGVALVAPPLSDVVLADSKELWQSIQDGLKSSFDETKPLGSLDLPGLPFEDRTEESLRASIRALAKAHPEADWLLISHVMHEDISRQGGLNIPLVVSRPVWAAECKLRVQFVDLRSARVSSVQTIEGRAVRRENPQLAVVSNPGGEVLSLNASRQLTFEAYRSAGLEIARGLLEGK